MTGKINELIHNINSLQKVSETLEKYNDEKLREVDEIKHDVQKAINDLEFKIKGNQGDGPEALKELLMLKIRQYKNWRKLRVKTIFSARLQF